MNDHPSIETIKARAELCLNEILDDCDVPEYARLAVRERANALLEANDWPGPEGAEKALRLAAAAYA